MIEKHKLLSPAQKGFLQSEGCLEHNFILQSSIQDAKRRRREISIAWLDLTNAFGSVPHSVIFDALRNKGFHTNTVRLITNLYQGSSTCFALKDGFSTPTPTVLGVRQGCPLSPILFNIAIDGVLLSLANRALTHGYCLEDTPVVVLAYADDLTIVSKDPFHLQELLDVAGSEATKLGLTFNPSKCSTLCIDGQKHEAIPSRFLIHGGHPQVQDSTDQFRHLGVPTGYTSFIDPSDSVAAIRRDMVKLDDSLLAPWQKIDATKVFLLTRL